MMLSADGMRILPEHFSMEPASPSIWKKKPPRQIIMKYMEALGAMASEPPNQKGNC